MLTAELNAQAPGDGVSSPKAAPPAADSLGSDSPHQSRPAHQASAQSMPSAENFLPEWHSMFTNIPGDWVRFARTSFVPEKLPAIVTVTALTLGLLLLDEPLWQESNRWYQSSRTVEKWSDVFVFVGDGRPQFGLAAGFAATGLVTSDRRALRTASQTVEAILSCGIVVQVLKHLTGRESPFVATAPAGRWVPFPNQIEYHKHVPHYDAYPSGHVATTLATVIVVAENYPEWWWVRPVGYTLVGLLAVGMGNTGIHWYSDYPLGLALGYSFGMLAAHPLDLGGVEGERPTESHSLSMMPVIGPMRTGFMLSFNF
jgi:PAP2 superfamily